MTKHHPRAQYLLALVQLWERFACFATLPLLVLYLQQVHGLSPDMAMLLFGTLQALSYLSGQPGGLLADRWLPLPVRAFGAIGCGLAVLLCGSFLIAQMMDGLPSRARVRAA